MKFCSLQIILLAAPLLLAAASAAQQSTPAAPAQQTPVSAPPLRAESRVVRVDVIVTDKKGNYVHDLTAKDFHVLDNNKEQPIVNFSFGSVAAPADSADRHYLLLLFDDSTMAVSDQVRSRDAALKFIDANVGPDRVMAVTNFSGSLHILQNFTIDADRLKRAAGSIKPLAASADLSTSAADSISFPILSSAQSEFGAYTLSLAIRSLARNLGAIPGRKSLILFTAGFSLTSETEAELTATISACNEANVAIYPVDVRGLIAVAPGAQLLPDERRSETKMQFASGIQTNDRSRGQPRLVLTAYSPPAASGQHGGGGGTGGPPGSGGTGGGRSGGGPAGTGGWNGGFGPPQPGGTAPSAIMPTIPDTGSANQSVLYALASGTGGFPILNTNDLLGGLGKIVREQDEYYLLGYAPEDPTDGACHVLRVKTGRGGLSIRARTGYCNVKTKDILAGKPIEKDLEARANAASAGKIDGTLEAPFFYTSPNEARVNLTVQVPSSSVSFSKEKGKFHADINILGIAYRPDGSVGARFSDTFPLDYDRDGVKRFAEIPLRYDNQFPVAPGHYQLIVIFAAGGQNFGKYQVPLDIDPYDGKTFTMSGIALTDRFEKLTGTGRSVEADLLADRTPLIVGDMEIVPSASNHFKRSQAVGLYAQIYDSHLTDLTPPAVRVGFSVVDVKTGKSVFSAQDIDPSQFLVPGSAVLPVGLTIPMSEFPPGTYQLDVQAYDATGAKSQVRTASFDSEDPQAGSLPQTRSAVLQPRPPLANAEQPSQLAVAPAPTPNPSRTLWIPPDIDTVGPAATPNLSRTSWIPPDIDTVVPSVEAGVECSLPQVVSGVGQRMKEFVDSLQKFDATETVEHFKVDAAGSRGKPETRTFDYVVTGKFSQAGIYLLDEYRNGSLDPSQFPAGIATLGLPSAAMIFHPNLVSDFNLICEGLGQSGGRPAWQIHFAQRADRPNRIRAYMIEQRYYPVPLKGRVWIDADTYQVRRLETELLTPVEGLALTQEHTAIDYGPVRFQTQKQELWLPQEAELYVERKGHRYYRRLTYSGFKIFAVEANQQVQAPKESYCFQNTSDHDISGILTVLPVSGSSAKVVSIQFTIPSGRKVCKLVGLRQDVNMPTDEVDSATFLTDGLAASIIADATVVRASTSDIVP